MANITIYQFEIYDSHDDVMKKSRRWGTRDAIEQIAHGKVIENTAIEVDVSAVTSDIFGFTEKNFTPHERQGFQKNVS
jgi:hypothetical protein